MTPDSLVPAAERALSAAMNCDVRLELDGVISDGFSSRVFRVRAVGNAGGLPPTLVIKAAKQEFARPASEMLFNEWASLRCLEDLSPDASLAARFYAGYANAEEPFVIMEDLGAGNGSPYEAVNGGDPDAAEQAIIEYARTLGRLHGLTSGKADGFRQIRAALPCTPKERALFHDPWSNACPRNREEIDRAVAEYRAVFSELGLRAESGIDEEIEQVTRALEEHAGGFLALCQGDQNSLHNCVRTRDGPRLLDFGVAGFRHALIEGMPHRMTWGCIWRLPRRLFRPFERAYRAELAKGCVEALDDGTFARAMVQAGGRWSVFHVIWRVPDALKGDRPRGGATLRQQTLAWLEAFAEMSEEFGQLPALGRSARSAWERLRSQWPDETHRIPNFPAFAS